jgi:hypothetical protein
VPGQAALSANLLKPYQGLGTIAQQTTSFWDTYHSIQTSWNRRFRNGVQFGANYTLGLSLQGNTGLQQRLQHAPDGSVSLRADQAEYEELNKNLDNRRHLLKVNAVWDMPDLRAENGVARSIGYIVNDWQLSGILTAGSAAAYDLTYTYQNNGSNQNLTGSPDYAARIRYVGDPGSGCSDNQFAQFDVTSVTGPTYNSVGLESGRNLLRGCPDHTVDLAIARNIRLGGGRQFQIRLDAFNAFNTVVINGRQTQIQYNSPTDLFVRNAEFNADGTIASGRDIPKNAGFGAATGAQNMRNLQLTVRFSF